MPVQHPPAPPASRRTPFRWAMHLWFRLTRPMTLGARIALIDPERGVFLVRHSYVDGWHMPGGGIEVGETALQSVEREAREEGNIQLHETPVLHGFHYNRRASPRDHVALYVCRRFEQTAPWMANREILEARFFPLDALPPDLSRATRDRLREILEGLPPSPYW